MRNKISFCYYPTTVVLIDDDRRFLQRISREIGLCGSKTLSYDNPKEFLNFFNNVYTEKPFAEECVSWLDEEYMSHRTVDVNIRVIRNIVQNKNRHNQISVVVTDFAMPSMDGIEMLKKMQKSSVKKILLTGEADESIAVKAFNAGIIDKYIRKDSRDFHKEVENSIKQLGEEFFLENSELIINSLTKDPSRPSCLDDNDFLQFFYDLLNKHKIEEYYLLDEYGSFLLINKKGKQIILVVKNEIAMEHYEQLAKDCDETPQKIIDAIKSRKQIPFLLTEEDESMSPKDWKKQLHKAKKIIGREIYYYAII